MSRWCEFPEPHKQKEFGEYIYFFLVEMFFSNVTSILNEIKKEEKKREKKCDQKREIRKEIRTSMEKKLDLLRNSLNILQKKFQYFLFRKMRK